MKKHVVLYFAMALCSLFFSFSNKGGDMFAIFLNGKPVLQQFVYADKSTKTLSLGPLRDNDKIEVFKAETSSLDKAITQYQQLILGGVDQIGVVKELGGNLTTVSYPDGWDLPVPTKYLIVLPEES